VALFVILVTAPGRAAAQAAEGSARASMNRIQWGRVQYSRNGRDFAITDPLVQVKNPALGRGARLPGFNDDYSGAEPDIGAFENGLPPLRFGRDAAPGFSRPPWELY
jgi:hypothetical protein